MKHWIVIHRYSAYKEHKDLIGLPIRIDKETGDPIKKEGKSEPKYKATNLISKGDLFAYYCPAPIAGVIGLFKIEEGPGNYAEDWKESIHFKISPLENYSIIENNPIPFRDLVNNLDYFKNSGNVKAQAAKMMGSIKELILEDFQKIEELYSKQTVKKKSEGSEHIKMITATHIQSGYHFFESFIGIPERKRVHALAEQSYSEEEEEEHPIKIMDDLPPWIENIAKHYGTYERLKNLDNIWFYQESPGFYVPFAAFEHEKDGNLRGVMDRFSALDETLNTNDRFKKIKPLYIIVAKDAKQVNSYNRKITEGGHGRWKSFSESLGVKIFPIIEVKDRGRNYSSAISKHLQEITLF